MGRAWAAFVSESRLTILISGQTRGCESRRRTINALTLEVMGAVGSHATNARALAAGHRTRRMMTGRLGMRCGSGPAGPLSREHRRPLDEARRLALLAFGVFQAAATCGAAAGSSLRPRASLA